jgi:transposase
MVTELTDAVRETIQSAARKLTGFRRRQFQAEVANQYCRGSARQAEQLFGWGRDAVETGLNELRTGIRCLDNFAARGRHRAEQRDPTLVDRIHGIVEPQSQADPKFQTPLAFTRVTAKAVREQLLAEDAATSPTATPRSVPAERTLYDVLNRLGYSLRRVRKTKPQKKLQRPTLSSTI